jgi:hypothetical protein
MKQELKYIKDKDGNIKYATVDLTDSTDLNELEAISKNTHYPIYAIPDGVSVDFNDDGWLVGASGLNIKDIWQFVKGWPMPYECFVNGFPFPVKMEDMWESDTKVEEIDVEELKWNLEFPWWSTDEEIPYNLEPQTVFEDIDMYPNHRERINNSETKYPLLLVQTKQNRWLIYDGVHRFVKQLLEGKKTVNVQKFNIQDMDKYIYDTDRKRFEEWKRLEYKI